MSDAELVAINPAELLMTANIRSATHLDKTFADSIKDHGVLVPIVARRAVDGALTVLYGHRRTAAAVAAGLATVPVMVLGAADEDTAASIDRVVKQWAENEHRTGLTTSDRVAAVDQLAAFGVSAAQIARRTKASRAEVDAALTVAKSTTARSALVDTQLTIEQASAYAEFDDDDAALETLRCAALAGQFDHAAQRLRDRRAQDVRRQAAVDALTAEGITIIDQGDYRSPVVRLSRLGENGQGIDPAEHRDCPGHVAYLGHEYVTVLVATGQEISDDDMVDEDPDELEEVEVFVPQWCCADPISHAHPMPAWLVRSHTAEGAASSGADEQSIEALAEARRRERREVIDNNKAWRSAETVRLDWLRSFLTRKTLPKQAAAFIADTLTRDPYLLTGNNARQVAADLLATHKEGPAHDVLGALIAGASEPRAHVLTLGLVLGAYEASTSVQSWRCAQAGNNRYLTYLTECGYTLADIERRACGQDPLPTGTNDDE
jgi:ParB family transcriptional regulator, chromosome partitioning protein